MNITGGGGRQPEPRRHEQQQKRRRCGFTLGLFGDLKEKHLFDLRQPLIPKQLPALLSIHCLIFHEKQSMREVSRGESRRINYLERSIQKKRKYHAPEKQSVRSAAQEFLEKASRELLGDNKNVTKGPLQLQSEDCEDES